MQLDDPRTRFAALAASPPDAIPLDEAAFLIAAEEYPDLDVAALGASLDELAARAIARARDGGEEARLAGLVDLLARELGFRGNAEDYYDPRNSFLNDVLERRVGIPISLGVIYMEVARRMGVALVGVSFPGHFLVRYPGPGRPLTLDVFAGATEVSDAVLRDRLRRLAAHPVENEEAARALSGLLRGASPRQILIRMLTNLKVIFLHRRDHLRALRAVERILLLAPDDTEELRARATLYHHLDAFRAALGDYRRYLELAPDAEDAPAIRSLVVDLELRAGALH
jgi:regulator of sirC expression with transglutaminase-like and TPR domain